MPPSPPPEHWLSEPKSCTYRRSSSLPPETLRRDNRSPRSLSPLIKSMTIRSPTPYDDPCKVVIEELSPDAIIPDSVTIYRDPEVEVPGEETGPTEEDLRERFTEIDLDRMRDDTTNSSEGSEKTVGKGVAKGRT